jgi:hypothetical protein
MDHHSPRPRSVLVLIISMVWISVLDVLAAMPRLRVGSHFSRGSFTAALCGVGLMAYY